MLLIELPLNLLPTVKMPVKYLTFFLFIVSFRIVAQSPLDSLMIHAESLALKSADYAYQPGDSLAAQKAVQRFMMDLKFGKQPNLRFQGYDFKLEKVAFQNRCFTQWRNPLIKQLAQRLIIENKEVTQILKTLQDSVQYSPAKKQLLIKAANEFRWLAAVRSNRALVLVNIPSAKLKAYESNKPVFQMKVVLGRASRPSKTLSSRLKTLILTPYWNVPRSISTKEILPNVKKNIRYLTASHLEVFDLNNQKMDPSTIDWKDLSINKFPYALRQRSGKWNTLGILKIQFDNPFKMYLHDTSEKEVFAWENRFLSHSCIRLENPIQLASWLLKPNSAVVDQLNIQANYHDKTPSYHPIKRNIPLVIWYSLVDFDEKGQLKFYPDIYRKN